MSGRVKKILEILFFLITCGTTYVLWFVRVSLPVELLVLLIGSSLSGSLAVGGGHARWVFFRRLPFYVKMSAILFVAVAIVLDTALSLMLSGSTQYVMVNGGFVAYLGTMELINAAFCVIYLFAPNKLHLSDKMPEE